MPVWSWQYSGSASSRIGASLAIWCSLATFLDWAPVVTASWSSRMREGRAAGPLVAALLCSTKLMASSTVARGTRFRPREEVASAISSFVWALEPMQRKSVWKVLLTMSFSLRLFAIQVVRD
eukprot:scaffold92217_cov41-Prasinocladus_malaysianus.AAC.1